MAVLNCKHCGKIFNYNVGEKICTECRQQLADDFQKTKNYLRANPNSSISDVSQACDVTVAQIKNWVRQERLVFSGDSAVGIECMGCGRNINTGKYCDECKNMLLKGLTPTKKKESPKKRHIDSDEHTRLRFK